MMDRVIKIGIVIAGLVTGTVLAITGSRNTSSAADQAAVKEANKHRYLVRVAKLFTVFLGLLGVGGLLVAASGIIPIKASSGHWQLTEWFLEFSKQRSVATNSLGTKAPPLDEPGLVLKGAGYYEIGCFPCHGSPEQQTPRIAYRMTPPPPYLGQTIPSWEAAELFYIVKHGIKFTGMPAWTTLQRDDEVWAMVAFLRKFPQLDAAEYRRLVNGEAVLTSEVEPLVKLPGPQNVPQGITENCARCHGLNGLGRGQSAFPKIAGQKPDYLELSMQAYARGERLSGIMQPVAAGFSQAELQELARYYASLPEPTPHATTASQERGQQIALHGIPSQRVPACVACHGPSAAPRNPVYPKLAGQYADYLELQLLLFKEERRGGTAYAHLMRRVAAGLTAEQMREVTLYYASLPTAAEPEETAGGK